MTSWTPLNIIPDSDSEGEIDNTEEIQIEEALKHYQKALRLHTEGNWEEAEKAYDELFRSEIFDLDVDEEVNSRNRTVASSLPLVHYLSYKNHGTFKLDQLKAAISTQSEHDVQSAVAQALEWFSTALGRDAGDSALWRETAQLALVLGSARLARFALESVLDHETVGADAAKDALSLVAGGYQNPEDRLAQLQLREVLSKIHDTVTLSQPQFKALDGKKLSKKFEEFLNPVPWLLVPRSVKTMSVYLTELSERRTVLQVDTRTWPAVGKALLEILTADDDKHIDTVELTNLSSALEIILPVFDGDEESRDTTPDSTRAKSETAVTEDNEDVIMTDASTLVVATEERARAGSANRKRKSTSMGVDGADAGRSRLSKRQRDKKAADAAAAEAAAGTPESKSKVRQDTQDEKLFNTAYECFSPFGLSLGDASVLKIKFVDNDAMDTSEDSSSKSGNGDLCIEDFKTILRTWDDDKGNVILYGDGIQTSAEAAQGMSFLGIEANIPSRPVLTGDDGLRKWARNVNRRGMCATQAAFEWLKALCRTDVDHRHKKSKSLPVSSGQSSWVKHNWPDFLKSTVISIANRSEEFCFQYFKDVRRNLEDRPKDIEIATYDAQKDDANVELAQTLLELYMDDLGGIEMERSAGDIIPDSEADLILRRQRLIRWKNIVGDLIQYRSRDEDGRLEEDQLVLRYFWATTVISGFCGNSPREFRLSCFENLRDLLSEKRAIIELPNSTAMPEISAARADREISKLKTMDFFSTIFAATSDTNEKDPDDVVDILEAVLIPGEVQAYNEEEERILGEIVRFLEGTNAMFKLHLWEKLKGAYEKVGNSVRVLSCTWTCMHVIMSELKTRSYLESSQEHRQFVILRTLRLMKQMINEVLEMTMQKKSDIQGLKDNELINALGSILGVLRMMHCYAFWETSVTKAEVKPSDLHSYRLVSKEFKETLVQGWVMAYHIYSEMLNRNMGEAPEGGWEPAQRQGMLFGLLGDIHEELGLRHYCKLSDHLFLKLMFNEVLNFNNREYDGALLQVVQCRFHLTVGADQWYFSDHRTDQEPLSRETALRLLEFIMPQASKKKVSQLLKSDLKTGLDKLADVLGEPPPDNARIAHNTGVMDTYLMSTIHPLRLFGCLRGELEISTVKISGHWDAIASKGLYFLLGKIALYPIRYTKRVGTLKGDELDTAIRFFKHDISCNPESWESWYRAGQAFEIQVEEAQTWNADGLNSRRQELVRMERRAILSYMMAVSLAVRYADDTPEARKTLSELYMDFGNRIYSAARPPMSSESFWTDGYEKHFSGQNGQGMYTKPPHAELSLVTALKYAHYLFEKALVDGEDNWRNHYMIGKCMAKLQKTYNYPPEHILEKFIDATKLCPEKRDEFVFEPHYKLISTAYKFVKQEKLDPRRACEILEASRFSRGLEHATTCEGFIDYTLEFLKKMKTADKQKWHHRMIYRMAMIRNEDLNDVAGARSELSCLFSNKAAQLSIWKPEFERPGRHFVFASRYTVLYVSLLEQLGDRATLEILTRRVRRVTHGLYRHTEIWSHVFDKYIFVLRQTGGVEKGHDEEVFRNITFDDFTTYSQRLDAFCNSTLKDQPSPALDLLREVFELRKLNSGLAKNPAIDDLLADAYAKMWGEYVPGIISLETEKQQNPMSLRNMMFDDTPPPPSASSGDATSSSRIDADLLPLRGKLTKVTRRELISKATNLCKELTQAPNAASGKSGSTQGTEPSSPRQIAGVTSTEGGSGTVAGVSDADEEQEKMDLSTLPSITVEE